MCFLVALLVLAEGCRREGLFDAIGAFLVVGARGSARRLLGLLFVLPALGAAVGSGPLLAALIGVNAGPNLTYVGSLATLLWRRVLHAEDAEVEVGEFSRLGALTVPAVLVTATLALWLSVRWFA